MPWILFNFVTSQEDSAFFKYFLIFVWWQGLQKQNKRHESNWAVGTGTGFVVQTEQLQVALFSTQLFTEEKILFLFKLFIFPQMKAPDNMWFMAFQPSGVFFF